MEYGVVAKLAWDGGEEVHVPSEMGKPRADQLLGTSRERLVELAGRVCYDSCGTGRNSSDYHKHIQEVGHLSVLEHAYATFHMEGNVDPVIFLNRPGLWVERALGGGWRVTANPRSILEWNRWSCPGASKVQVELAKEFGRELRGMASPLYPQIVREIEDRDVVGIPPFILCEKSAVEPQSDEERWVTMFMIGSRGFSHELVRHGDFTAISQRSTRFVDEDGSPWIDHPLVQEYVAFHKNKYGQDMLDVTSLVKVSAGSAYRHVASHLQSWLIERGVDKFTARKQARGAARGYLGNALQTELIFSASVGQWKRMLRMRCSAPADAEIRAVFSQALAELKRSRYAKEFDGFQLEPATDGLGQISVEAKP